MRNAERWLAPAWLAGLACLATAATVWAQNEPHVSGDPRLDANRAKAVDQGVADRNPLSASERVVPLDLRQPTGFERLFEITGPGGRLETRGTGGGVFFRVSGALVATFPRSEYVGTPIGERAVIPAGTVFSIGGPRPWMPTEGATVRSTVGLGPERSAGALGVPQSAIRSARRAASASEAEAERPASEARREAAAPESLWTSEAHRRATLERLIRTASDR